MQKIILKFTLSVLLFAACSTNKSAVDSTNNRQPANCQRYQQHVDYKMSVDFDATKHQYKGSTHLVYTNNSPDALNKVFFHLYPNAFQPGSAMDVRSLNIEDPDGRVGGRISKLKPDEIGYLTVENLKLNGKNCLAKVEGTILEVTLPEKITPNNSVNFDFNFSGQVPIQIRRSGRDNKEGVAYSMTQWYPKMCEYDEQGWHSNPYIAREFYGVWGNFDVSINMDSKFTLFGSGILQNAKEIGRGYTSNEQLALSNESSKDNGSKLKAQSSKQINWHFSGKKIHDFMWAADPNYKHVTQKADDGTLMHFFYIPSEKTKAWEKLPDIMAKVFAIARDRYGKYPYSDFSFVQGGDGGMEYPMSTLITGERPINSLAGVAIHEMMHSWYQGVLATNESLYPWMDEGFTTYAESNIQNVLKQQGLLDAKPVADPMKRNVESYCRFALSGKEEALSTHADHYNTNAAYGVGSYTKGSVFLQQIKYIVGENNFNKGMLRYFDEWQFRHPSANDFIRVQEKNADIKLDWFREYFVNTTKTIDYAMGEVVSEDKGKTKVELKRIGSMIMPIDVTVTYRDGKQELFYIPLDLMRGEKPGEDSKTLRTLLPVWTWAYPTYSFTVPKNLSSIKSIEIDASGRMADVNRTNNTFSQSN